MRALQEHPEMYTRVDAILETSTSANSKFFALQVSPNASCPAAVVESQLQGRRRRGQPAERRSSPRAKRKGHNALAGSCVGETPACATGCASAAVRRAATQLHTGGCVHCA